MATTAHTEHTASTAMNKEVNGTDRSSTDHITRHMTHEEHEAATKAAKFGYGPLAHVNRGGERMLPAFGGEFQPGLYKQVKDRKLANPAPLGLSAFALTTFVLGLINMGTRGLSAPNLVVGAAFGYGGLVQLLAGMWEIAAGNTFGATALASYGGFWISFAIIFTPGGFQIQSELAAASDTAFYDEFGFYLMGWFIFTFLLLICTLRSTVAFFSIFFFLDMAFLLLGIAFLQRDASGMPNAKTEKAGGLFALLAAFAAWYNALAGIADDSNSFFVLPVVHFPWSDTGMAKRGKLDKEDKANV